MPDKTLYIMTRFNIGLHLHPDRYDYDLYMMRRVEWFWAVTVPSVLNQSCQNFKWLVLIDKETPAHWKRALRHDAYRLVEIDCEALGILDAVGDRPQRLIGREAVAQAGHNASGLLLTARLDSDDCLARHYVWRVRKALRRPQQGVAFVQGFYWYHQEGRWGGGLFTSRYRANMFPAVCSTGKNPMTVFEIDHPRLHKSFKMQYELGGQMWLYNWLPDGMNLQNFTSRNVKRTGRPRCQGGVRVPMNEAHIKKVFGINTDKAKEIAERWNSKDCSK